MKVGGWVVKGKGWGTHTQENVQSRLYKVLVKWQGVTYDVCWLKDVLVTPCDRFSLLNAYSVVLNFSVC